MSKKVKDWDIVMGGVLKELYRITKGGGWVAFEVGEVKNGTIKLEEHIIPLGEKHGFICIGVLINKQIFTKTSNLWGINNNKRGTNSNRVVIFTKKNDMEKGKEYIENLKVNVKYEFNTNNATLYEEKNILAEGNL